MLDVFSGRPNPGWRLTQGEAAELAAHVAALSVPAAPLGPPRAGWRGFLVLGDGPPGMEPVWFRVKDDVVELHGRAWRDASGIATMLESAARRHGFGPLLDEVRNPPDPGSSP